MIIVQESKEKKEEKLIKSSLEREIDAIIVEHKNLIEALKNK